MDEQSLHTDTVNDWITGYLTNSLTPEEMQSLQEWLNVSEENRKYFSDMQEVWIAASDETDDRSFNKERAYQLFLKQIEATTRQAINKRKAFQLHPWMYAAAMIIIVFICGTIAFQIGKSVIRNQLTQISIEAPYGSKTKLYLPDGTLVWLNAGSKMSYAQDFGINERALNLTGEAYFEVTKNKHIPFKVHTDELDVKVLGTKFNFRNYQDDLEAKVCLLEGKVALSTQQKETILHPDQQALLDKKTGKLLISSTKAAYSAEWTNDRLYFDEALLPDIVKELERSYNIKITIADAALNSVRFYGNFRRREQSIREIMDVLSSTDKMTYTIEGKNIVITLPE
ncbi:FecR family protein [Bacteroides acidifaciens]|uniref:FecR family protein n=1 Tax=Bacteroides acidifaciens TaxID=85831 RepID=UPI00158AB03A|nr:FecR domain-containing protein [Bacteroides acidifaciens]